jgi:putative component of membrane protein insertase Oxa1/YidC/SpoIIIJ protein YidD
MRKITVIILVLLTLKVFAQNQEDMNFSENFGKFIIAKSYRVDQPKKITHRMFNFYKKRISSQDSGNCNFHPSCSVYGLQSVQRLGFSKGFLNTFDRLSRCHGLNKKDYTLHIASKLLYDPVL